MIISIKATNVQKTPQILKRVEKICAKVEKFVPAADSDTLAVKIEVGRITRHHRKGIVYRAEINVTLGRTFVRAKAAGGDVITALGEAQDEVERRLLKAKKRTVSIKHREGVRMKKMRRSA